MGFEDGSGGEMGRRFSVIAVSADGVLYKQFRLVSGFDEKSGKCKQTTIAARTLHCSYKQAGGQEPRGLS